MARRQLETASGKPRQVAEQALVKEKAFEGYVSPVVARVGLGTAAANSALCGVDGG